LKKEGRRGVSGYYSGENKRTGRDRSSKNLSYIYERYIWPTKPFWKLHYSLSLI
jgi:hypothetical protein